MSEKETEEGKVCAILSYLLIGIIWCFADENMKKNAFAKFHAKQGLVLLISFVAVTVISFIIGWIPWVGKVIVYLIWLCLLVLWLIGIINAATGKESPLPIIGSYAENLKI